jgi:hypothetical protein
VGVKIEVPVLACLALLLLETVLHPYQILSENVLRLWVDEAINMFLITGRGVSTGFVL